MTWEWVVLISVLAICFTICVNICVSSFRFNYSFIKRCVNDYIADELIRIKKK